MLISKGKKMKMFEVKFSIMVPSGTAMYVSDSNMTGLVTYVHAIDGSQARAMVQAMYEHAPNKVNFIYAIEKKS